MKKLLIIVNVDWFLISHRLQIALAAKANGYEVHIATSLTNKLEILQGHGFITHPIKINRSDAGVSSTLSTAIEIFNVLKSVKPSIVHLVTIKPILLGGIAARLAGVPAVVVAVSGLGFIFTAQGLKAILRRSLVTLLYRIALSHKNIKVIFQNSDDKKNLIDKTNLAENNTSMIRGSGVDLMQYTLSPQPEGVPIVLMAARLLLDKGVREFVQASRLLLQRLDKSGNKPRFILVGEPDLGNPASLSTQELHEWINEGIVEHWGHRTDMSKVLSAANIIVLPSYYGEGLPKVLIEAAACGRAVVTTNHPGCRDAITPGKSGLLVPVRNSEALADAIQYLIEHPEDCNAMGLAGRELAEHAFDVHQVAKEHLRIYDELLDKVKK